MRPYSSTQALLDELAARERHVLEQLQELSEMSRSPISPRQAYASVQATPHVVATASPSAPFSTTRYAGDGEDRRPREASHGQVTSSRGTVGNLEQDLERLQQLLRHSPLSARFSSSTGAADAHTPELQRHGPLRQGDRYRDGAAAVVHDKRARGSPATPLHSSPTVPEGKRDRRETASYAAPPSLHPLSPPSHDHYHRPSPSPRATGSDVAVRNSVVLDVTEDASGEGEAERAEHERLLSLAPHRDVLFSQHTKSAPPPPLAGAYGTDRTAAVRSQGASANAEALLAESRATTQRWRHSPVRWVATASAVAEPCVGDEEQRDAEDASMLGTTALHAWQLLHSARRHHDGGAAVRGEALVATPPHLGTSPPSFRGLNGPSLLEVPWSNSCSMASPPPRAPHSLAPVPPQAAPAPAATPWAALRTPAQEEQSTHLSRGLLTPHVAATPQLSTAKAEEKPRAFVDVPPRVALTTSWQGLKAFFTRQATVSALRTPDVASLELDA